MRSDNLTRKDFIKTMETLRRTGVLRKDKNVASDEFKKAFVANIGKRIENVNECISKSLMQTLLEWYDTVSEDQMSRYFLVMSRVLQTDKIVEALIRMKNVEG